MAVENEASGTAITRKGRAIFGDSISNAGDRRRCHAPPDSEISSDSENHCAVQANGK